MVEEPAPSVRAMATLDVHRGGREPDADFRLAGLAPRREIREPHPARRGEVIPAPARGQLHEQIGQGDVGSEPR